MGKPKAKQQVTEYRLSLHAVFGAASDAIKEIWVNEKQAWSGTVTDVADIDINKPDLFGGVKQEGGLIGTATALLGKANQLLPEALAARYGLTSATSPGYRRVTSIFFHGSDQVANPNGGGGIAQIIQQVQQTASNVSNALGFCWSHNNPIVAQSIWVRGMTAPKGLDPAQAMIGHDANPAHIVYEVYTDALDGIGEPTADMDTQSFLDAGATLLAEGFGLSPTWAESVEAEDFIESINTCIQATVFRHPFTGLHTMKLLRDDYDIDLLPVLGPTDGTWKTLTSRMAGRDVNEITLFYTDRETDKPATITYQDIGSAHTAGVDHDDRKFPAIKDPDLAATVCQREVRAAVAPLKVGDLEVDRKGWKLVPGECFLVESWPEEKLTNVVFRIGKIDYGKPGDSKITLSVTQDIFSLSKRPLREIPPSSWTPPGEDPTPITYVQVLSIPYYFASGATLQAQAADLVYPETLALILAHQDGSDTPSYDLTADGTLPDGTSGFLAQGTKSTLERVTIGTALVAEQQSTLPGNMVLNPNQSFKLGGFVFLGTSDANSEICQVVDYSGGNWVINRGMLDTVPKAWAVGTPLWIVNDGSWIVDDKTIRSAGEVVDYKLLSRTSKGILPLADAPDVTATLTDRPHRPLRPSNCSVNGTHFGSVALGGNTSIVLSWATRNRTLEDGQTLAWFDNAVPPEYRQSTVVQILNGANNLEIERYQFWNDTGITLPASYFARFSSVKFVFFSSLDGLDSLQSSTITLTGLANNPSASPPPAPPALSEPPSPVAAPGASAFSVVDNKVATVGGGVGPALVIGGTQDNQSADGLVVRYKPTGTPDWTYWPTIQLSRRAIRVPVTGMAALATFNVQVAYVVNNVLGEFRSLADTTTANSIAMDVISVAGRDAVTMRNQVDTALTNAQSAIDLAMTVEGVADGAAAAAATAATAAQTASDLASAAIAVSQSIVPGDFNAGGANWSSSYTPDTTTPLPSQWSFPTLDGYGKVARLTADGSGTFQIVQKHSLPMLKGHKYRATSFTRVQTDAPNGKALYVGLYFIGVDAAGATQYATVQTITQTAADGVSVITLDVDADTIRAAHPTVAFLRVMVLEAHTPNTTPPWPNGVYDVIAVTVEDVTGTENAKAVAISTAQTYTNGALAAYDITVQAQFAPITGQIATAKSQAISAAQTYTDGAISTYNVTVQAQFSPIAGQIATAKAQAISSAQTYADSAISTYNVTIQSQFSSMTGAIATAKSQAISTSQTYADTAVSNYNVTVQSQFSSVTGQISTAKSQAISTAQTYTDGAVSTYNNSVSTSAGGLSATVSESFGAIVELNGKLASKYALELSGGGVTTGIYAIAGRGVGGTSISGIKLRVDKLVIVPSDESTTKIPFTYDATLGKLILNEVIALTGNIGDLTVTTIKVVDGAIITGKVQDNAITQSISSYTQGAASFAANTEVAVQSTSITTISGSRVEIDAVVRLLSTGTPTSYVRVYRRPSGGSWSLLYEIPGPTPYVADVSLTTATSVTAVPSLNSDVVTGVSVGSTSASVSGLSTGTVSLHGTPSWSGSISLSGNTNTAFPSGDTAHDHGLGFSASVNTSGFSLNTFGLYVQGSDWISSPSVTVPTVTVTTGRPTLSFSWPISTTVTGVTVTYKIDGTVPVALVDTPGSGNWEYELRAICNLSGSATHRFLKTTEVKK